MGPRSGPKWVAAHAFDGFAGVRAGPDAVRRPLGLAAIPARPGAGMAETAGRALTLPSPVNGRGGQGVRPLCGRTAFYWRAA
ncbi:hypothetical protein [Lysobacter gummosus]|uniref:hypothetical protein n=1 Tax=Lysobacter gummosus TaxID=262324 RepID=UPI00362F921D